MSLFVENKLIGIEHYYVEQQKQGNSVVVFITSPEKMREKEEEGYSFESSDPDKKIYRFRTTWKRPTWKEHNEIISRSMTHAPSTMGGYISKLDPIMYREQKLKTCLKKWDGVMGLDGQPVELTLDAINSLSPEVGQELLDAFERVTEISSEQLKN